MMQIVQDEYTKNPTGKLKNFITLNEVLRLQLLSMENSFISKYWIREFGTPERLINTTCTDQTFDQLKYMFYS